MNGTHLVGLVGTNPIGFLSALGIQVVFASRPDLDQPFLWWSDDITPHAIVDEKFSTDFIVDCALEVFGEWVNSIEKIPSLLSRSGDSASNVSKLKFKQEDLRTVFQYLSSNEHGGNHALSLMASLLAEGSLDNNGMSKPTDLYFAAGNMKFLDNVIKILNEVSKDDVITPLKEEWPYNSLLPSLMWDVHDDRHYALRATDPSPDKKMTNPGLEALAIGGLSLYPVYTSPCRTLTTGCSGTWKKCYFSWPLWKKPAKIRTVRSLITHAYHDTQRSTYSKRNRWYYSWGVYQIYGASIHRSDQGGYGTFSPPEVKWDATSYYTFSRNFT